MFPTSLCYVFGVFTGSFLRATIPYLLKVSNGNEAFDIKYLRSNAIGSLAAVMTGIVVLEHPDTGDITGISAFLMGIGAGYAWSDTVRNGAQRMTQPAEN